MGSDGLRNNVSKCKDGFELDQFLLDHLDEITEKVMRVFVNQLKKEDQLLKVKIKTRENAGEKKQ